MRPRSSAKRGSLVRVVKFCPIRSQVESRPMLPPISPSVPGSTTLSPAFNAAAFLASIFSSFPDVPPSSPALTAPPCSETSTREHGSSAELRFGISALPSLDSHFAETVQMDGSFHRRWLEERGARCRSERRKWQGRDSAISILVRKGTFLIWFDILSISS